MRLAELLRLTAIGIALLCWLDPPVVVMPQPPVSVDVAVVRTSRDAAPAANSGPTTVGERATEVASAIMQALGADGDVRVHEMPDPLRLPCDAQQPCVIVAGADAGIDVPSDRQGHTSLVRVGDSLTPNVVVVDLSAQAAHASAEGSARVVLRGTGLAGHDTRVRLLDGVAVVGEAVHHWAEDGDLSLTVPWWPIAVGTRTLKAEATTDGVQEHTTIDNTVGVLVEVANARWPVIVHERRPSWAATFVRRALEADPRFAIEGRTELAPRIYAGSPSSPARLADEQLDRARVVVVGAPDVLTNDDVSRLDAFVRLRGGALILVPDRPFAGPVTRLLRHTWTERLDGAATPAGPLRASEWLVAEASSFDEVLAATQAGTTVMSSPVGRGRIVIAGAMDAWRERGTDDGFDRFWRGTVAQLAHAAESSVAVSVEPRWARQGEEVTVRIIARSVRLDATRNWSVAARLVCGDTVDVPLRMWPADGSGTFVGRARPPASGLQCVVEGQLAGIGEGRAALVVLPDAATVGPSRAADLDALADRTGGVVVSDGNLAPLIDRLRALASDTRTPEPRYPMRSPWWLLPLAGCLSGEWWLRRRAGLR